MTKFINLDALDERIKQLHKPTPQQVVNLITVMYREVANPEYMHKHSIGLMRIDELPYGKI